MEIFPLESPLLGATVDNIRCIINHWRPKFTEDASKIKERILEVRSKIVCNVNTDSLKNLQQYDDPREMEPYWFIHATSGEHYAEINHNHFYCTCHSFECSAKGLNNKLPCKHLYVLACWGMRNF